MSNLNIDDYGMIWGTQLVTTDEMNIQLNQLSNQITYMTDELTPCILYGGNLSGEGGSTLSITAGVFRGPDYTLGLIDVYNEVPAFFKIEAHIIDISAYSPSYIGVYAVYTPTSTTSGQFVKFVGSIVLQLLGIAPPANSVLLGNIIITGSPAIIESATIPGISYAGSSIAPDHPRYPDFSRILVNNQYLELESASNKIIPLALSPTSRLIRNYVISEDGLPTTLEFIDMGTAFPTNGEKYDYEIYTVINNNASSMNITVEAPCTINSSTSYTLAANSTKTFRYNNIARNWIVN